jgi:two-component system phosphate regulon response regulator PhoB
VTILVVGTDAKFCRQLQELLSAQGHRTVLSDPARAVQAACEHRAVLVVLDGIPGKQAAMDLVRSLRAQPATRQTAIFQVDPRGAMTDVVELLDAGADDYLIRPFNGQIFLARVRTLLRRQIWSGVLKEEPPTLLEDNGLVVHLVARTLTVSGKDIPLTRLEFELLSFLVRNKEKVLKRTEILEAVWKYPADVETRTLDKHIETLRKKLGAAAQRLRTVHGIGYKFSGPVESPLA